MVQPRDPKTGRFISTGKGRISIAAAVGGIGGATLLSLLGQSLFAWIVALVLCSFALCLYVQTKYGNKAFIWTLFACIILSGIIIVWQVNTSHAPQQPNFNQNNFNGGIGFQNSNVTLQVQQSPMLTQKMKQQLDDYLKSVNVSAISLQAYQGDNDAFKLASQIREYLVSENYIVSPVQFRYPNGAEPSGIEIIDPDKDGIVRIIVGNPFGR